MKVDLFFGPSDILFVGLYVCTFQPGNFTGWGSEGVNNYYCLFTALKISHVRYKSNVKNWHVPFLLLCCLTVVTMCSSPKEAGDV